MRGLAGPALLLVAGLGQAGHATAGWLDGPAAPTPSPAEPAAAPPREPALPAAAPHEPSTPAPPRDEPCVLAIPFDRGATAPSPEDRRRLARAAATLAAATAVRVEGHTDSAGDELDNLRLSRRRAEAVAALLQEGGAPRAAITVRAYGAFAPEDERGPAAATNRRVLVTIYGAPRACEELR